MRVGLHVSPAGLGITLDMVTKKAVVHSIKPEGSVHEWNCAASPQLQICPGDRIDTFRIKGQTERALTSPHDLKSLQTCRAIVFNITKPSSRIILAKAPFGLVLHHNKCGTSQLVISSVLPSGSIQKWNEEHPDEMVSSGDIVISVDGVLSSAVEMKNYLQGCKDAELEILHYSH